nr:MAG TPA_asm: hypothetical protein [Caudoviricetes sp.]
MGVGACWFRLMENEKSPRHAWTRVGGFGL